MSYRPRPIREVYAGIFEYCLDGAAVSEKNKMIVYR